MRAPRTSMILLERISDASARVRTEIERLAECSSHATAKIANLVKTIQLGASEAGH